MNEVVVEKITEANLPNLRKDYLDALGADFGLVPGVDPYKAYDMAWENDRNSEENMVKTIRDPKKADYYLALVDGHLQGVAKIGDENYGDRPDLSKLGYKMARLLHKLGFLRPTTKQIFALGISNDSNVDQQEVFNKLVEAAVDKKTKRVSAFVDTGDERLRDRMCGLAKLKNRYIKFGKKVVSIVQGNVARDYTRESVRL